MTLREIVVGIAAALMLVLLLFGFRSWIGEHDARTKAESVQAAQQTIIDQAKSQADAAKADMAKVQSDLQAQLAAIAAEKKQPVTAPQFVVDLNKLLPNLPQPATVVQGSGVRDQGSGASSANAASPANSAAVLIPAADLPDLKNYKLDCDANAASLAACQRTVADQVSQLKAGEAEFDAMTKDRDMWKTAAGKGSILQRLGKRVKCLAIVGGAAALGGWADKSQPARGAAIGATAGGIGCELF